MSSDLPLAINWTDLAWEDLDSIADYLFSSGESQDKIDALFNRIMDAPENLATLPGAGKPGRLHLTREWRVKNTPHALIYTVSKGEVRMLRVMHDSRLFPED